MHKSMAEDRQHWVDRLNIGRPPAAHVATDIFNEAREMYYTVREEPFVQIIKANLGQFAQLNPVLFSTRDSWLTEAGC